MRFLAFLLMLVCSALAGAADYEIERFSFDATLKADGTMDVQERIEVVFSESSHGIFRTIPIHYDTGKGTTRDIYLTNIRVNDGNGNGMGTKITTEGRYLKIRIGDADVLLNPGTRLTYVISYTAEGMINWFDQTDEWVPSAELYWGMTGEEWDAPMHRIDFKIRFPQVPGGKGVRARLIYGPYGSSLSQTLLKLSGGEFDQALETTLALSESEVYGSKATVMPPYNGLTMVLSLPSTVIAKPTFAQQATRLVQNNLGFSIPLIVLGIMSFFWWKFGRDPYGGPMAVQFDPPDGVSGSELGALLDERVDQRDLAAGIISLAVKGYLKIIPKEEGLIFKKRGADLELTGIEGDANLTIFERSLLKKLSKCDQPIDESQLRIHVAPHVAELRNEIYASLVDKRYYITSPEAARNTWGCLGIVGILALAALFWWISPFHNTMPSIVGGIIGVILIIFFAKGMPRRTDAGAKAHALAKGFEEFVRRARQPELEWMSKKHPDAVLFETYLPHAVAMGLTREWAQAFEGIVNEMPNWYAAPYGTPFHPMYFGNDIVSISDSMGAAAAVPPRSSGGGGGSSGFSSGGGFSGGGFGGGGGGSW